MKQQRQLIHQWYRVRAHINQQPNLFHIEDLYVLDLSLIYSISNQLQVLECLLNDLDEGENTKTPVTAVLNASNN